MKTKKHILIILLLVLSANIYAQDKKPEKFIMSIPNVMRDLKWIGNFPSGQYWSEDSDNLYFMWNPDNSRGDSLYAVPKNGGTPRKVTREEQRKFPPRYSAYTEDKTKALFERNGDIFLVNIKTGNIKQITRTSDYESNARFTQDETKITFMRDNNLYMINLEDAGLIQLTNFKKGNAQSASAIPAGGFNNQGNQFGQMNPQMMNNNRTAEARTPQTKFLADQQVKLFDFLKRGRDQQFSRRRRAQNNLPDAGVKIPEIYIQDENLVNITLSPDERFITFTLYQSPANQKGTVVPNYVTASGFTEEMQGRTKVGADLGKYEYGIYDLKKDSLYYFNTGSIPGIREYPKYFDEYPNKNLIDKSKDREVSFNGPIYSPDGKYCIAIANSRDYKDKWILKLDLATGKFTSLFRERNEAWIGGPGGYSTGWMPDKTRFWFESEASGYAHLYTVNVETGEVKQLTNGNFEVSNPVISKDKKYWYFTSNEVHPGERHFYRMPINGGKPEKITTMTGNNEALLSPDEKNIAILYSYSNKPPELYLMENKPGAKAKQITSSESEEFKSYAWRDPEVITIKAEDGANIYARLYKPDDSKKNGAAVMFVHGAGYLQNAHKWWSEYTHEYMFNNLLADSGYTVLDIDYRGSAGYGRDWRTGIYRHMGGKDLSDHVDAAKFLVNNYGIDPNRIGLYGGSYGGFITLMAMFTKPGVFASGAALRPVTDWAHYNHGYTAEILNLPYTDSLAYVNSSPIYFADGLKGNLLICHGVVDDNVHFQDVVRLSQKLIELGKDNWSVAFFPVESHSFVYPTSWTDEYKRIYKLFKSTLLKK